MGVLRSMLPSYTDKVQDPAVTGVDKEEFRWQCVEKGSRNFENRSVGWLSLQSLKPPVAIQGPGWNRNIMMANNSYASKDILCVPQS